MLKGKEEFLRGMKSQLFGVEVELTGISIHQCELILAEYFHDTELFDSKGRDWNVHGDGSITAMKRNMDGSLVPASNDYQVELVTPILEYDDIPMLQEIIRRIRNAGGISSPLNKCGIHVHVSHIGQDQDTLRNLVKLMRSKQYLLERALRISSGRITDYCQYADEKFAELANKKPFKSLDTLKRSWEWNCGRYYMLNLSSFFENKGIEFRLYNGTLHAGEIKSYVQLSLALAQAAKDLTKCQIREPKNVRNDKYSMRNWLVRMHLTGDEFKTLRKCMTKNLSGESAFADPHKRKAEVFVALNYEDDFREEDLPFD